MDQFLFIFVLFKIIEVETNTVLYKLRYYKITELLR